jgi:hypothetical protein
MNDGEVKASEMAANSMLKHQFITVYITSRKTENLNLISLFNLGVVKWKFGWQD